MPLLSCSHKKIDESIEKKMEAEAPISVNGRALASRELEIFQNADNLSDEQKENLIELHTKMQQKMRSLKEEKAKLTAVLFRTLVSPDYQEKEYQRIKKRFLDLSEKKNTLVLQGLEKAQRVLGRRSLEDMKYYRFMIRNDPGVPQLGSLEINPENPIE